MKKNLCNSHSRFPRAIPVISIILLIQFSSLGLVAQNKRAELEKQKKALLIKIRQNQVILDQTSEKKSSSLGRLRALNNQISSRSRLISAISEEVQLLDERIEEDHKFIDALDADLKSMKEEYTSMIYATQKTSAGFDELTFLFAAETFDQLFMRLKYIKQYANTRRKQSEQIKLVQKDLNEQIAEVEEQKTDKQTLLNDELAESDKLQGLRSEQRKIVQEFRERRISDSCRAKEAKSI